MIKRIGNSAIKFCKLQISQIKNFLSRYFINSVLLFSKVFNISLGRAFPTTPNLFLFFKYLKGYSRPEN